MKATPGISKTTALTELNEQQFLALWGRIDGLQAKGYIIKNMVVTHNLGALFVEANVHDNPDADPLGPGDTWFSISQFGNVSAEGEAKIYP